MGGGVEKEFKVNNLFNLPIPFVGKKIEVTSIEKRYIKDLI